MLDELEESALLDGNAVTRRRAQYEDDHVPSPLRLSPKTLMLFGIHVPLAGAWATYRKGRISTSMTTLPTAATCSQQARWNSKLLHALGNSRFGSPINPTSLSGEFRGEVAECFFEVTWFDPRIRNVMIAWPVAGTFLAMMMRYKSSHP
ncbi:MAG: hypothetical protein AAF367_13195 [Pseudomonadota bacterium]